MKKLFGSLFILGFLMLISGCGNPGTAKDLKVNDEVTVTIRDLQANDWVVEGLDDKADYKLLASFSDHVITFNIDTSTGRWKEIEKDLAKSMAEELTFEFEYSLKGNKLIRKIDDSGEEVEYKVAKEGDIITLTPDKDSENATITLRPYEKKETTTSSKVESATDSSNREAASADTTEDSETDRNAANTKENTSS